MTTRLTRIMTIPAALALALSAAACSSDDGAGPAQENAAPESSAPAEEQSTDADDDGEESAAPSEGTSADAEGVSDALPEAGRTAIQTALDTYPGTVVELDRDGRDGTWKVTIITEDRATKVKVRLNADGTQITETDEHKDLDRDDLAELDAVEVDIVDAINAVMAKYPGVFDEAELDTEDGVVVWQVEINHDDADDTEMLVDVKTGDMRADD